MVALRVSAAGRPASLAQWQRLVLSALAGLTLGHPPIGLPWAWFVAVPALVWLLAGAPGVRAAALTGWAAGFGYFVTVLHWIGNAFLVEPERFALLLPLAVVVLPAGLALFWGLAFALARRFWPGGLVSGAVLVAGLISAVEVARSFLLTGFPWALPGYVWIDLPPMQAAAWVGPFGMTLLTLILTALPLLALVERRWAVAALSLAGFAALWIAGAARLPADVAVAPDAPVIRIVQPNAPQHLKFLPGHREEFYRRALEATAAPADPATGVPDVVLWPETAIHFLLAPNPEEVVRISQAAGGATVILGAFHREAGVGDERWMNTLATVYPDGSLGPRYDKHHLVPFGEYIPFWSVLEGMPLPAFVQGPGFAAGPGPRTVDVEGLPAFSALICYEAIFPWQAVAQGVRPEWMVQLTNDAWFGEFAGPQQHYAQARIRAIEQGLPMARAANTGISAVIDPYGREVAALPLGVYANIDSQLPSALPPTLYSRTGDWPALLAVVFAVFFGAFSHARVEAD